MQIVVCVGVRIYVDSYWSKSTRRTAVVILTDDMRFSLIQYSDTSANEDNSFRNHIR